jgi:hypothetical protein
VVKRRRTEHRRTEHRRTEHRRTEPRLLRPFPLTVVMILLVVVIGAACAGPPPAPTWQQPAGRSMPYVGSVDRPAPVPGSGGPAGLASRV